jgi:Kef-type K+ transport system membrane component KefB
MSEIYLFALVVCLAAFLGIVVKRFKQPLLVSYLAAGALLSAFHIIRPEQLKFLSILPEVGLAFLLFLVGMELDLREFRSLGKNVLLATFGQVVITAIVICSVGVLFDLPLISSAIIGLAISFSSTILVVKLLLEGKELSSIYGKLSIGILLVEDLMAVVVLMLVSVFGGASGDFSGLALGLVALKGLLLFLLSLWVGKKILPKVFKICAENSELLFLTSIAWCLLFVSLSVILGFSLSIGAFLAGVSLAQSVYRIQISSRIKPLRDFFIMIFFLDLGTGLTLSGLSHMWPVAIGILLYVAVLKPVIFFLLFTAFKFRAHSAFQTGILLSSLSEFSLILLTAASKQGLVPESFLSAFIFATVISFVSSSLLITHGRSVYAKVKRTLKTFEEKETVNADSLVLEQREFLNHAVLIGCHRSGEVVLPAIVKNFENNLVVLDFNPDVIAKLRQEGIACIYGDVSDVEIVERLNLPTAKLLVSTIRDLSDNLILLDSLTKLRSKAVVIMTAYDSVEALTLYMHGAHHVSLPLELEGANISHMITHYRDDFKELQKEKVKKVEELQKQFEI